MGRIEGFIEDHVGHGGRTDLRTAGPADDPIAQATSFHRQHATELAASQNAEDA